MAIKKLLRTPRKLVACLPHATGQPALPSRASIIARASSSLDKTYLSPARWYRMILLAIEVMGSLIRECVRSGEGA